MLSVSIRLVRPYWRWLIVVAVAMILIMDEPSSGLVSESEHLVFEGLRHLTEGRTTFVIAHRLSTIRNADCIFVLDQGRIVERGRHADLVASGGLYTRMQQLQADDDGSAGASAREL